MNIENMLLRLSHKSSSRNLGGGHPCLTSREAR